jgi:hypothetical protein
MQVIGSLERAYLGVSTAISDSFYNSIKQSNSGASELHPVPDNTVDRLDQLKLTFSRSELRDYTNLRIAGLSDKTINWLKKAADILWAYTKGEISRITANELRNYVIVKYSDIYAKRKVINFAKAFFRYLSKTRFDARYQAFELYIELPKAVKERKHVTSRIVTKADIENVLTAIERTYRDGEISLYQYLNYRAIMLFGATSGQRPIATIARLTIGHFKAALNRDKPVLDIPSDCDKIRMQHYCPLHPQAVDAIIPLLNGQSDDECIFEQLPFERWLRQQKIPLIHANTHFIMSDTRKFCEQEGDILQWNQSNKNYILTHNVKGVDWRFYKSPRAEPVYDVYMRYWQNTRFAVF